MNTWLLWAAALLGLIGVVHSVMGERRIFRPWERQPPAGVRLFHQQILRGSWHLASLLGFGADFQLHQALLKLLDACRTQSVHGL